MSDDPWKLSDAELEALTPDEAAEYDRLLARMTTGKWTLDDNPKAHLAHLLAYKVDWLLAGGAAGGGKSEMLLYHAREVCASVPGAHALIVRTSKPELQRSLVVRSLVRFAQTGDNRRAKLAQRDNVRAWWWQNRSILEFGHLDSEVTAGSYLSAEYDLFCADESTQLTPKVISMLAGRLRTTVDKAAAGSRPHAVFASNPGDISHEWHKELFVDLTDYGRYVVILDISEGFMTDDGEIDWEKCVIVDRVLCPQTPAEAARFALTTTPDQLSIAFVPFRATDNPFVDPSVMRGLNALPEMQRKQRRDGDWDAFTGRYFTEFGDPHIVAPFDIDDEAFDIGIGLDHGYAAPFAAVFGAWDSDGNCYIFDEVYEKQLTPSEQARLVLSRLVAEGNDGKIRPMRHRVPVADPATFNSKGEGLSIAQQWSNAGLHCVQANNARIDGWMNVREYLRVPISEDGVGRPKLFVFSTCSDTIREFRNARQDPRRPDDVDTTGDDHAIDAVRYLLATRPRTRRRAKRGERWDLPRAERIEHARLDKIRTMGKRQARRLGLG